MLTPLCHAATRRVLGFREASRWESTVLGVEKPVLVLWSPGPATRTGLWVSQTLGHPSLGRGQRAGETLTCPSREIVLSLATASLLAVVAGSPERLARGD